MESAGLADSVMVVVEVCVCPASCTCDAVEKFAGSENCQTPKPIMPAARQPLPMKAMALRVSWLMGHMTFRVDCNLITNHNSFIPK